MSDDVIARLFDKLDLINQRVARVEAMLEERKKRCEDEHTEVKTLRNDIDVLKNKSSLLDGARGVVAWIVTTAIACAGAWGSWHK